MSFKLALRGAVAGIALASAFTAINSAPASAQSISPIYGVGETMADQLYRDLFNCMGSTGTSGVLGTAPAGCTSGTPPLNTGVEVLYAAIGPAAQSDYLTHSTSFGSTPINTGLYQDTAAGFSYPYTELHFGAGEIPLTAAQIASSTILGSGSLTGPAIQVPTLVTSVTIPFHSADLTGLTGLPIPSDAQGTPGSSELILTTSQLCGIFNGSITDWSDARLAQSNSLTPSRSAKPIQVVYRNDASGITFLMSNALITQCASTSYPMNPAWGTTGSTTYFVSASSQPATWVNETALGFSNGDEGMADAMAATDGALGYLSPDFAQPYGVSPHVASETANLINSSGTVVPPTPYSASQIMASVAAPSVSDDAATWGQDGSPPPNPSNINAYPIGGFSWIYLYTCYASRNDFLNMASGSLPGAVGFIFGVQSNATDVDAILAADGFAKVPNAWFSVIRDLLFSDTSTKLRTGPSAGVCTGGA